MIRRIMWIGLPLCVFIGAGAMLVTNGAALHAADSTTRPAAVDYQKIADAAGWVWRSEMADPLGCVSQCGGKYDIRLLSKKGDRHALTIMILANGKEVFTWQGHRRSAFRILGDRLYYAEFHPSSSGGKVVAVDLTTGKKLWTSPLKALGSVQHSAYRNLMNLDVNDEVVTVWGNESLGRYVEFKSAATGETLGNKVFPPPAAGATEALQGLQSLTRVRVKAAGLAKSVRDEVVKQLREQLPQLDTEGSSDDWTLEFVLGVARVEETAKRSSGPTPMVPVRSYHCRLSRPVVVGGRSATAVAYEGPAFTGKPHLLINGYDLSHELDRKGKDLLLCEAVAGFAEAWRKANPGAKQK